MEQSPTLSEPRPSGQERQSQLRDFGLRRWIGVKTVARLANVQRLMRQANLVQRLAKKSQDGTVGKKTSEPQDEADDTITVGDTTNHYHRPPATNGQSLLQKTLPYVLAAALGAGGSYLATRPSAPPPPPADIPEIGVRGDNPRK